MHGLSSGRAVLVQLDIIIMSKDRMRRYYSLFTLGMLVMFECTVVGQRLRNLRELRSLTTPKQALQVYRQGKWVQLPGDALLPGDVISIGRPSGGTFLPSALPNTHDHCFHRHVADAFSIARV